MIEALESIDGVLAGSLHKILVPGGDGLQVDSASTGSVCYHRTDSGNVGRREVTCGSKEAARVAYFPQALEAGDLLIRVSMSMSMRSGICDVSRHAWCPA